MPAKAPVKVLPKKYTVMSLYSGAGGLDLGFSWAGFEPIWANDFVHDAAATYTANLGSHMHEGDILQLQPPKMLQPDIIIGGPPCQGFSVAGKMDPSDPRSKHVFTFLDIVKQYKPQAFVMENVKSLAVNTKFSLVRKKLFNRAKQMGYHVELIVLNAADYDVPQARERMFFIGCLHDAVSAPTPTSFDNPRTVRDVLATLPPYGHTGNDSKSLAKITAAQNPVMRSSAYAGMLFNGAGRPLDLDAPSCTLPATMGGNRTPIIDQRQLEEGKKPWVVGYHRRLQKGAKPAVTIPPYLRRLTVQEAAALQTFPHDYVFHGKQSSQFHQIGNAVPPVLAYHIANAVRATLDANA